MVRRFQWRLGCSRERLRVGMFALRMLSDSAKKSSGLIEATYANTSYIYTPTQYCRQDRCRLCGRYRGSGSCGFGSFVDRIGQRSCFKRDSGTIHFFIKPLAPRNNIVTSVTEIIATAVTKTSAMLGTLNPKVQREVTYHGRIFC